MQRFLPRRESDESERLLGAGRRPSTYTDLSAEAFLALQKGCTREETLYDEDDPELVPGRGTKLASTKHCVSRGLKYVLEVMCDDLDCYGELLERTYNFEKKQWHRSLKPTHVCYGPEGTVPRAVQELMLSAGGQSLIPGMGLAGMAWQTQKIEVSDIAARLQDPFFNKGGLHLDKVVKLFTSAAAVPFMRPTFTGGGAASRVYTPGLMGVVVLFSGEPAHQWERGRRMAYMVKMRESAPTLMALMAQRSVYWNYRGNRVKRNWKLMKIVFLFLMPMLVKYAKMTGADLYKGVNEAMEAETPHLLRVGGEQQTVADVVQGGEGYGPGKIAALLSLYIRKWEGGMVSMPARLPMKHAVLAAAVTFICIALLGIANDLVKATGVYINTEGDAGVWINGAGGLVIVLYGMPATPLGQPRLLYATAAMVIAISVVVCALLQNEALWLRTAVSVGVATAAMTGTGYINAGMGGLVVAFVHNAKFVKLGLLFLLAPTFAAFTVVVALGILLTNLSPQRSYPAFW